MSEPFTRSPPSLLPFLLEFTYRVWVDPPPSIIVQCPPLENASSFLFRHLRAFLPLFSQCLRRRTHLRPLLKVSTVFPPPPQPANLLFYEFFPPAILTRSEPVSSSPCLSPTSAFSLSTTRAMTQPRSPHTCYSPKLCPARDRFPVLKQKFTSCMRSRNVAISSFPSVFFSFDR